MPVRCIAASWKPHALRAVTLCVGLLAVQAFACHSPSSPGDCVNGVDGLGRGPFQSLAITCAPSGSDIDCKSIVHESGYCAAAPREITGIARWISTDAAVGTFSVPGHLQIRASGTTVIHSETSRLYSRTAFGYRVAPGMAPQQMIVFEVVVFQINGGFLPTANVEFTPETGEAQTCQQGIGSPFTPCRFWSDGSPAVIRAFKTGYTSVQQSLTPKSTNLAIPDGIALRLAPFPAG
jgi:hypothetical protein